MSRELPNVLMTCRGFRNLFDAHLDGELSEPQSAELHAHLIQCPECQREVELLRAAGDVIALDARGPRLPADFSSRVLAAVQQRAGGAAGGRGAQRGMRRWFELGAVPALAAALALGAMYVARPTGRMPAGPSAPGQTPQGLAQAAPQAGDGITRVAGERVSITDLIAAPEFDDVVSFSRRSVDQLGRAADRMGDLLPAMPGQSDAATDSSVSAPSESARFVSELMRPFFEMLDPRVPASADADVERF